MPMKKRTENIIKIVSIACIALCSLVILHYARRVFICDRFIIKGHSMEPTLYGGRAVYVNKLIAGPRVFTDFDFSQPQLHCLRLPGLRDVRVGDFVVYNTPAGKGPGKIGFKVNYVYAKRCAACPGDTLSIIDSHYVNSRTGSIGVPLQNERRLKDMPDSMLLRLKCLRAGQFASKQDEWTIKDFGPVIVPRKGMSVTLSPEAADMYSRVIEYETGLPVSGLGGQVYTFAKDYYFFVGDNVCDSRDSRYDGFVPEDFIVGVFKP